MTADPTCPGVGPSSYQSTTCALVGTITWWSGCRPNFPTAVLMPRAGITSLAGLERANGGLFAGRLVSDTTDTRDNVTERGSWRVNVPANATTATTSATRATPQQIHWRRRRDILRSIDAMSRYGRRRAPSPRGA